MAKSRARAIMVAECVNSHSGPDSCSGWKPKWGDITPNTDECLYKQRGFCTNTQLGYEAKEKLLDRIRKDLGGGQ